MIFEDLDNPTDNKANSQTNTEISLESGAPAGSKLEIVKKLEQEVLHHQKEYYNNTPEISDEEFDALWDRLRTLDVGNVLFAKVGKDNDSFFSKKVHIMPMGSLDKVSGEEQLAQWVQQHKAEYYLVQHKLDGASLELQYNEGLLKATVTRGNGKRGDDILINARNMQGVRRKLSEKRSVAIRGEVIMTHAVYDAHFSDKANCRNAANGLMKRKDGKNVHLLQFICYDLWFPANTTITSANTANSTTANASIQYSEVEKLALLADWGFTVVSHTILHTQEEINSYRNRIIDIRASIGYDIDGLVIKMPSSDPEDMQSLRPDRQIAYKFPLEYAQTKIVEIEWSESGHLYTPVAILEPVQLAGTTVRRASLVNPRHVQELGANIGAEVLVVKRGEIIPKIEKVVIPSAIATLALPKHCATCGAKVENQGTRIFCTNLHCKRRLLFRIERWCAILEIEFWGETLLHKFVMEEKLINSLADLYRLEVSQLVAIERIGQPLAEKLIQSLHSKKLIPFEIFLAGLAIDGVALLTAEKIVQAGISDWQSLVEWSAEDLAKIDTVGPILASNIVSAIEALQDEVQDVYNYISITKQVNNNSQALKGLSFCFTGALSMPRKTLQSIVKQNAGQAKSAVSKDLHYLVTDDVSPTSEKSKMALKHGITIISEEEFIALLSDHDISI